MYAISGATTGSGSCMVNAAYESSLNAVGVGISDGTFSFNAALQARTMLTAGTYTLTDAPEAGATYLTNTTDEWGMCNNGSCADGAGNAIANFGTFTMTITDPGPATAGVLWMAPHGSIQITMPSVPNTTSTGTVTANVTF